jgi:ribosomal protein S7
MPRRKKTEFKREIGVDPRFKSSLVQKLINTLMHDGKKTLRRQSCIMQWIW